MLGSPANATRVGPLGCPFQACPFRARADASIAHLETAKANRAWGLQGDQECIVPLTFGPGSGPLPCPTVPGRGFPRACSVGRGMAARAGAVFDWDVL